jgi:Methyltransferase domain
LAMRCKVCEQPTIAFSRAKILSSYWVSYRKCESCGFICTEEPYWLNEAYSSAINSSDLGLVQRNIQTAYSLVPLLSRLFKSDGRFIDYGGGYGLMVRMMRDRGFDFSLYDQYCENLFAKGFDIKGPSEKPEFELLTAIEVFEHLPNPKSELQAMLKFSENIFFTTELLPMDQSFARPGSWSYFGLEHGQHVSFYTKKSLSLLAQSLNLNFCTNGDSLHLFSRVKISDMTFKILSSSRLGKYLSPLMKKKSLLLQDYKKVTGHEL